MKNFLALLFVASLAGGMATTLYAVEDHRPYRDMKVPECNECHRDANVPPNHQVMWNREHRVKAEKLNTNCGDCHDQAYCMDCHFGGGITAGLHVGNDRRAGINYMPRTHRSDFREIHPIQAYDNPASCRRCHPRQFCQECHDRFRPEELMYYSHRRGWSDLPTASLGPRHATFTPAQCPTCHPNSVLPSKHEWTNMHRREVRRSLESCQACHSDGQICLRCHSARTGLKVNPHPDNWGGIDGKLNRAAGQRTCVKCH